MLSAVFGRRIRIAFRLRIDRTAFDQQGSEARRCTPTLDRADIPHMIANGRRKSRVGAKIETRDYVGTARDQRAARGLQANRAMHVAGPQRDRSRSPNRLNTNLIYGPTVPRKRNFDRLVDTVRINLWAAFATRTPEHVEVVKA